MDIANKQEEKTILLMPLRKMSGITSSPSLEAQHLLVPAFAVMLEWFCNHECMDKSISKSCV
jgi:hypothetical protein